MTGRTKVSDPKGFHARLVVAVVRAGGALEDAVRAVLARHQPLLANDGCWYCEECSHFDRSPTSPTLSPCRTTLSIGEALGVRAA